jgi:hypothetical protein
MPGSSKWSPSVRFPHQNLVCTFPFPIRASCPAHRNLLDLTPRHGASSGCGWRNGLQIWRVATNILNKQSRTADKGWSSNMWVGRGANNSLR